MSDLNLQQHQKEGGKLESQPKPNPFAQKYIWPKLTLDDPLIMAVQKVIDEKLGLVKLNDEEIKKVIDDVNDIKMFEWWNVGWTFKCLILKMWFEKLVNSDSFKTKKFPCFMENDELERRAKMFDFEVEEAIEIWLKYKI